MVVWKRKKRVLRNYSTLLINNFKNFSIFLDHKNHDKLYLLKCKGTRDSKKDALEKYIEDQRFGPDSRLNGIWEPKNLFLLLV